MEDCQNSVEISENECETLKGEINDDKLEASDANHDSVSTVDGMVANKDSESHDNYVENNSSEDNNDATLESVDSKCGKVENNVNCELNDKLLPTLSPDSGDKGKDNASNVDVANESSVTMELCHSIAIQTDTGSSAFTKCQDDSGTEDSESDSSSESETESSSEEKEICEQSDSSLEEVVRTPVKARTEDGVRKSKGERQKKKFVIKYKNELDVDDLPPIEDLHITVLEDECEPLGTVYSIVNQLVVIQSLPNTPALNLDSLLFKKDGHCLGQIFDVFGPVKTPFYTLRFNSRQDVVDKGIEKGQTVYCAPQTPHTKYVFVYQLMQQKGSDASWKHNYEVPDAYKDYSDDEEERKAKRKHHQKTRGRPDVKLDDCTVPPKHIKKEFSHGYEKYTGNEWYKSRVVEMNQFNRFNQSQRHYNKFQNSIGSIRMQNNRNPTPNSNNSYPISTRTLNPPQGSSVSQPLLRPSTPNNWLGSSTQYNNNSNGPQSVSSSNINGTVSTLIQQPPPFSRPPPPVPQPPFSGDYDRLSSSANFNNPMSPFSSRIAHTPPRWMQTSVGRNFPFRNDNTRRTDLTPPRPLPSVPHLPRPNMTNIQRPFIQNPIVGPPPHLFNRPPPGPSSTF